jgi:hypothetical protein
VKSEDIRAELRAADAALAASELLVKADLCSDAMSRAYYAVLHYVRSLLLSVDIVPRSHQGAFVHFGREFVKPGIISQDYNRIFVRLMKLREEADYITGSTFSRENVEVVLQNVREFRAKTVEILGERNFPVE